jgi:UDP-4-amino-4,6-dideoxy-N-acetyl-beta-L-altrosamine transaminase
MIPYGRQEITQSDIDAVVGVLRSDFLTQGPAVKKFEEAASRYTGALHACAVNSATAALHLACLALGVGPGDTVWTSPLTFVASANCALYCGASVDFVDVSPDTFNMSVAALTQKLKDAAVMGRLPKVVIPVHLSGLPCEMSEIHALSLEYGFHIIEDASHAVGARYLGNPVGNCMYSDICIFSFHPVKIITTGEGGMALTNQPLLARRLELLRSHGITRDPEEMSCEPHGPWYYQQIALGFNYRMTDIQAALGTSQLSRVDAFVERRKALACRYNGLLTELPVTTPAEQDSSVSSRHLYVIQLHTEKISKSQRDVFEELKDKGIAVNLHYIPVYWHPYYQQLGFKKGLCPNAEAYYARAVSLPLYPGLSDSQQDYIVEALGKTLHE